MTKRSILKQFLILLIALFGCSQEIKTTEKKEIDKKEFLNHEILNDSIHYRIKEYDKRNHVYRKICVFNKDKLLGEQLIYKVQKKDLMDEGYFVKNKKLYELINQNTFSVFDINSHFHDYNLESVDTNFSNLFVTPEGEIEIEVVSF